MSSPDLTLDGGLYREEYQNAFNLRLQIILNYPVKAVGKLIGGSTVLRLEALKP